MDLILFLLVFVFINYNNLNILGYLLTSVVTINKFVLTYRSKVKPHRCSIIMGNVKLLFIGSNLSWVVLNQFKGPILTIYSIDITLYISYFPTLFIKYFICFDHNVVVISQKLFLACKLNVRLLFMTFWPRPFHRLDALALPSRGLGWWFLIQIFDTYFLYLADIFSSHHYFCFCYLL